MDSLLQLLSGLSARQRLSIAVAAILTASGIFAFTRWKRESDFRPLYTAMAPEDAAAVVQKLKETGIDYRLEDGGGSVLAPSSKLAESRLALAAAGLPKTGRIGFELFDKSAFGATEFVEKVNYKRALEGELERTVMSLAEVEQARVHLTLPKESIFLDKQQPAKASVVLKLRPLAQLSQQNVLAVSNLVAAAVEGLGPEAVSIVDVNGNLLNRPRRTGDASASQYTAEALEVRQQLERDLVAKVVSTVEPVLGQDRFRAGASVECDLTSGEQQEETYDPTHSVMSSSQKTEDANDRASAGGIPGTASNLSGGAGRPAGSGGGTSRRTESVTYQSSRVVRQTHIPQGVIKRMSLSVLVDNTVRWEGVGAARRRILDPPPADTLKTIKDLVAAATGFNSERGDQLIVESLPFESSLNAEPPKIEGAAPKSKKEPPLPKWQELFQKNRDLMLPIALGIGVVLFLIRSVLVGLRRKRKPAVESPVELPEAGAARRPQIGSAPEELHVAHADDEQAAAAAERTLDVAGKVREIAQKDLDLAANVVRLWLQESDGRAT